MTRILIVENNHHQHQAHMFVTFFFGVLGMDTGMLTYANAGHLPPDRPDICAQSPGG